MNEGSTSAKMNWVCRLAVRLIFQNIHAKYMAKISWKTAKIWWRRSKCWGGRVTFHPQEKPRWKSSTINLVCWWHLQRNKNVLMTVVLDRSAPTLIAWNETYVEPGSLLMTDYWKGDSILDDAETFWHETVNHQYNFVDPVTGAHRQSIDCLWREAKTNSSAVPKELCPTPIPASFYGEKITKMRSF